MVAFMSACEEPSGVPHKQRRNAFLLLLIFSVIAFVQLPVSLLPAVQIPEIVVKVNAPNYTPQQMENRKDHKITAE